MWTEEELQLHWQPSAFWSAFNSQRAAGVRQHAGAVFNVKEEKKRRRNYQCGAEPQGGRRDPLDGSENSGELSAVGAKMLIQPPAPL